jgi:hypothetical protein
MAANRESLQVEDVQEDSNSSCGISRRTRPGALDPQSVAFKQEIVAESRRDSRVPKSMVSIVPQADESKLDDTPLSETATQNLRASAVNMAAARTRSPYESTEPDGSKYMQSSFGSNRKRRPASVLRLPLMQRSDTTGQRLTFNTRVRFRNDEPRVAPLHPREVFRETSKEMRVVSIHNEKARVPLHLLRHQKQTSHSSSLTGELTSWGGAMDDRLRFASC